MKHQYHLFTYTKLGDDKLNTWSMDFLRKKAVWRVFFLFLIFLVCSMENITDRGIRVDIIYISLCDKRPNFIFLNC